MKYFTEAEVRELFPMKDAVACMRQAFLAYDRGEAQNQPRRRLRLASGSVLHQLAGSYGNYFGAKIYSTNPKHGAWFKVLLYDAETAAPLAEFEANHLGQIRTGAASGLATDLLTPPDVKTLAIIGTGFQARTQVEAVLAVRPIQTIRVWSRKVENRTRFAEAIQKELGVAAVAANDVGAAIEGADVVVTATYAKSPVFDAAMINGPVLINAMGSNQADRAEVPAEVVRNAQLIVADDVEQCRIEAGDLVLALDQEGWKGVVPLAALVAGKAKGPSTRNGPIVFKSVGLGLEDVAAAAFIYEKAASIPGRRSADPNPATR